MKLRDLSYLAVRILSIYVFFLGINHLVNLLNFSLPVYLQVIEDDTTYLELLSFVILPAVFLILCGIVLWFFADKLSRFLIPRNSDGSELTSGIKGIEGFILSVAGLVIVIFSFSTIVRMSLSYIYMTNQEFQLDRISLMYTFIEQLIRLVIGMILLFKAEGLALTLRKIRDLGLKHLRQKDGES